MGVRLNGVCELWLPVQDVLNEWMEQYWYMRHLKLYEASGGTKLGVIDLVWKSAFKEGFMLDSM